MFRKRVLSVHIGEVTSGTARCDAVVANVDAESRTATTQHHSATHLLHSGLFKFVGDHVEQQGSVLSRNCCDLTLIMTNPFPRSSWPAEGWVNEQIAAGHPVNIDEMDIASAKGRGAKALFGEKYGDVVHVVDMGGIDVSVELCCHVASTADIRQLRIVREEASSAGASYYRRCWCRCGTTHGNGTGIAQACGSLIGLAEATAQQVAPLARLLKAAPEQLQQRVANLAAEAKRSLRALVPSRHRCGVMNLLPACNLCRRLLKTCKSKLLKPMRRKQLALY